MDSLKNIRESWMISWYLFLLEIRKPRLYVIVLGTILLWKSYFSGLAGLLVERNQTMHWGELFVYVNSSPMAQMGVFMMVLFLVGNAPYGNGGVSNFLIRTKKENWLRGQLWYVFGLAVGYVFLLTIALAVCCGGQLSFVNEWSQLAWQQVSGLRLENNIAGMPITMSLLAFASPGFTWLVSAFLCVLWILFLAEILICVNVFGHSAVGYLLVVAFWCLDLFYRQIWKVPMLPFFSPCFLVRLGGLNLGYNPGTPGPLYACCFFGVSLLLMYEMAKRGMQNYDFFIHD